METVMSRRSAAQVENVYQVLYATTARNKLMIIVNTNLNACRVAARMTCALISQNAFKSATAIKNVTLGVAPLITARVRHCARVVNKMAIIVTRSLNVHQCRASKTNACQSNPTSTTTL